MISKINVKQYCKDFQNIENYELAIADTENMWHCHHRLETHDSDGNRRLVDITNAELISLNMYFDRPPEELIFMTQFNHLQLHKKGKIFSEDHKLKLRNANLGRKHSEESKYNMSVAHKGNKLSEKTKRKLSELNSGIKNHFYGKKHS